MDLPPGVRRWYQKKRYFIPLAAVVGLIAVSSLTSSQPNDSRSVEGIRVPAPHAQNISSSQSGGAMRETSAAGSALIPTGTGYTNVDGSRVPSPAYFEVAPAGATARCRDGTYSFSQHRSGTCSHHGGVARWQ